MHFNTTLPILILYYLYQWYTTCTNAILHSSTINIYFYCKPIPMLDKYLTTNTNTILPVPVLKLFYL